MSLPAVWRQTVPSLMTRGRKPSPVSVGFEAAEEILEDLLQALDARVRQPVLRMPAAMPLTVTTNASRKRGSSSRVRSRRSTST